VGSNPWRGEEIQGTTEKNKKDPGLAPKKKGGSVKKRGRLVLGKE